MPPSRSFLTPLTGHIPSHVIPEPVPEKVSALALQRLTGRTKPRPIKIRGHVYRSIHEACVALGVRRRRIEIMLRTGKAELCKPAS